MFPKISIITPSYNQGKYLEETLLSVINQKYPNLEYIVIDGNSNDNSMNIIKKYEKHLSYWVSEPDKGQYDACNKGINISTGDILTYLNSDDILQPGSLFTIAEIFINNNDVEWIGCIPNQIDELGRSVNVCAYGAWNKFRYYKRDFKYIQQEGTFWRRTLWEKAGGYISTKYKFASDLELWSRFFEFADYHVLPVLLGSFRLRGKDQKTLELLNYYLSEAEEILNNMPINKRDKKLIKLDNLLHLNQFINIPLIKKLIVIKEINAKLYSFPKPFTYNRLNQSFQR